MPIPLAPVSAGSSPPPMLTPIPGAFEAPGFMPLSKLAPETRAVSAAPLKYVGFPIFFS